MDLQLGLSLSSSSTDNLIIKLGFDLNNQIYESKDNFDSETTTWSTSSNITEIGAPCLVIRNKNKRGFDDDQNSTKTTLPLLLWNDQPNEEEDDDGDDHLNRPNKRTSYIINDNQGEEEVSSIVGWPPVKSWMRKKLHHHHHHRNPNQHHQHDDQDHGCVDDEDGHRREGNGNGNGCGSGSGASKSMYVKVMMEGMPIGRKVDLSLHQSYQTLTTTLIHMFGKYQNGVAKGLKDGTRYTLTYQDKEGDWLLVGDVPWRTFIESVQRLKILRDGC